MKMKKLLPLLLVICIGAVCFAVFMGKDSEKTTNDREVISILQSEMQSIVESSMVSSLGDAATWHVYELGLMYEKNDDFFKRLRKDLGEDFQWKLSNGDSLFIGILPYRRSFRIYAGKPDENHMIYPDWRYTEVTKE